MIGVQGRFGQSWRGINRTSSLSFESRGFVKNSLMRTRNLMSTRNWVYWHPSNTNRYRANRITLSVASLYAIQSLACDKCRTTFQAADPASGQTAQGAMPPPSSTALFHNPYESGESDRSQMLSAHSYPPILLEDSLVDRLSQQNSPQQNSLLLSNVQGSSQIFSTTDHDGRQHLRVPSISSRSSDSDSDGQYLHISLIPPSPSASNSEHEDRSSLSRHHLSVRDARDAPEWSISFGTVKPLIDVKLADVLVFQEMVSCVKFSHDGNYLAVGLDNGHTYIHNMKLEKKTWFASQFLIHREISYLSLAIVSWLNSPRQTALPDGTESGS